MHPVVSIVSPELDPVATSIVDSEETMASGAFLFGGSALTALCSLEVYPRVAVGVLWGCPGVEPWLVVKL